MMSDKKREKCPAGSQASLAPTGNAGGKAKSRELSSTSSSSGDNGTGSGKDSGNVQCSVAIPITSISKPSNKQGFRFSLRRMLYNSPLVNQRRTRSSSTNAGNAVAGTSGASSNSVKKKKVTTVKYESEVSSEVSGTSHSDIVNTSKASKFCTEAGTMECPLCLAEYPRAFFPDLLCCSHQACLDCLQQYLRIEISESRINICCPECSELMHPNDIRSILNDEHLLEKYEDFMLRRVLAADPDSRWCPAPDCSYVVIASGCASCPRLQCQKSDCGALFCYHCKALWHPNQTCDAARAQRTPLYGSSSISFSSKNAQRDDIKPCPRCQVLITKMDDGSCNHMTCTLCGAEFCWLCMKEISDLHYLSPSGCTFWGKKPWSRKKKILWQLGTLVGAPVGIALLAGIAIPAMVIGIPIWVGRKLYARYKTASRHKRNIIITSGVAASIILAPAIAGVAVGVGVPVLLAYVYGVVPVSLCRSGVCGVTASQRGVRIDFDDEENGNGTEGENAYYVADAKSNTDAMSVDTANHMVGNPSIGEASVALSASGSASLGSATQLFRPESDREDCESASQMGLAGSIASRRLEVQAEVTSKRLSFASETASATISLSERSTTLSMADDGAASTRALAGSLLSYKMDSGSVHSYRLHGSSHPHSACGSVKSGYTPVEVHVDAASQRSEADDESTHQRSSSPVSNFSACGDELPSMVRRSARKTRCLVDRQISDNASLQSSDDQAITSGASDHVRFDDNVSYIDRAMDFSPTGSVSEESSLAPVQLP